MALHCGGKQAPPYTSQHGNADTTQQIFPSRIREIGTSVAVSTQWLFNFMFSLVTPYMIASWNSYTFLFYAALDVVMSVMVFLFLKETRGKSIEEMETIFNSKAAFDVEVARRRGKSTTDSEEILGHVQTERSGVKGSDSE